MKRGIIVAAAAISVTGAASANLFKTSDLPPVPQSSAAETSGVAAAQRTDLAQRPAQASANAPVQQASVDIRQAPVPMQPRQRAPVASALDNLNEFYAKAQALVAQPSVASERRGESAARAAIEADGYKNVQVLRRSDDGAWHAKAFRGKTEVQLIVDARGGVSMTD